MADDDTLKLHLDDAGSIWLAAGVSPAVQLECPAAGILRYLEEHYPGPPALRILGTAANAGLILQAYALARRRNGTLELAGPMLCSSPQDLADPPQVLYGMRACVLPSSLGGWHKATAADQATYRLIHRLHGPTDETPSCESLLLEHPVWRELSFIPTLSQLPNRAALVRLLAEIVDPRWYIDPEHPNRISRLTAYLGLTPANQQRVEQAPREPPARVRRCALACAAWWTDAAQDRADPRNFLWRVYHSAGGGTIGRLRASQKFIVFLRYVWMQSLAKAAHSRCIDLFEPDMLFKHDDELAAYRTHCGSPEPV